MYCKAQAREKDLGKYVDSKGEPLAGTFREDPEWNRELKEKLMKDDGQAANAYIDRTPKYHAADKQLSCHIQKEYVDLPADRAIYKSILIGGATAVFTMGAAEGFTLLGVLGDGVMLADSVNDAHKACKTDLVPASLQVSPVCEQFHKGNILGANNFSSQLEKQSCTFAVLQGVMAGVGLGASTTLFIREMYEANKASRILAEAQKMTAEARSAAAVAGGTGRTVSSVATMNRMKTEAEEVFGETEGARFVSDVTKAGSAPETLAKEEGLLRVVEKDHPFGAITNKAVEREAAETLGSEEEVRKFEQAAHDDAAGAKKIEQRLESCSHVLSQRVLPSFADKFLLARLFLSPSSANAATAAIGENLIFGCTKWELGEYKKELKRFADQATPDLAVGKFASVPLEDGAISNCKIIGWDKFGKKALVRTMNPQGHYVEFEVDWWELGNPIPLGDGQSIATKFAQTGYRTKEPGTPVFYELSDGTKRGYEGYYVGETNDKIFLKADADPTSRVYAIDKSEVVPHPDTKNRIWKGASAAEGEPGVAQDATGFGAGRRSRLSDAQPDPKKPSWVSSETGDVSKSPDAVYIAGNKEGTISGDLKEGGSFSGTTNKGAFYGHNQNEDAILATQTHDGGQAFFVFDGAGGHGAGDVASHVGVLKLKDEISSGKSVKEAVDSIPNAMNTAVKNGHGSSDMMTVMVGLEVKDGKAITYHAGDARLKIYEEGKAEAVYATKDHSWTAENLREYEAKLRSENPNMPPDEFRKALQKKELELSKTPEVGQSVKNGYGPGMRTSVEEGPPVALRKGDRVLLMSDGGWDNIPEEDIERVMKNARSPEEARSSLEYIARENMAKAHADRANYGKPDNISIIVLFYQH
jgi:PPM family protein phosphatase